MLEIKTFVFGLFQTNTYVVSDEHHVWLIDPACSDEYERQQLLDYIRPHLVEPSDLQIIATHGHLDHLWGAPWATELWHRPVMMHEADIPMAKAMQQQYDLFGIPAKAEPFPVESFPPIAPMSHFQLLETPGHTPGSVCLYWPEEKILFSGDTLFRLGYGRTDLPGGNYRQLIDSIKQLYELPSDVQVYPGHGESTTIGAEK